MVDSQQDLHSLGFGGVDHIVGVAPFVVSLPAGLTFVPAHVALDPAEAQILYQRNIPQICQIHTVHGRGVLEHLREVGLGWQRWHRGCSYDWELAGRWGFSARVGQIVVETGIWWLLSLRDRQKDEGHGQSQTTRDPPRATRHARLSPVQVRQRSPTPKMTDCPESSPSGQSVSGFLGCAYFGSRLKVRLVIIHTPPSLAKVHLSPPGETSLPIWVVDVPEAVSPSMVKFTSFA